MVPAKKKMLIIGNYIKEYPRNKALFSAFKKFFSLQEINVYYKKRKRYYFIRGLFQLGRKSDYIFLIKSDKIFIFSLLFFKLFYQGQVIFDAFTSVYDSYVYDRRLVKKYSLKAFYYYILDYLSCLTADILVFDTLEHKEYFFKTFKIKKKKKFIILPVVVDLEVVDKAKPRLRPNDLKDKFIVLFYGYYIPLQGIEYIIKAAKILTNKPKIHFLLIGSGQTRKDINELAKKLKIVNTTFIDRVPYSDLLSYIKMADVCLGIFGHTGKARRVIPNKVIDSMACAKIVITGKNPAMARYFEDKKNIVFCRLADAVDLAQKIEWVYNNYGNLSAIGPAARRVVENSFSLKALEEITKKEFNLKNRIVVYTAIFGGKDNLIEPKAVPKNCDFICFTDMDFKSKVWQIKKVKPPVKGDPVRSARKYKILPHRFLSEYEYSVWVDGNLLIHGNLSKLVDKYLRNTNMAVFSHANYKWNPGGSKWQNFLNTLCRRYPHVRNCLYEEGEELIRMSRAGIFKDDVEIIKRQLDRYKKEGYPKNNTLIQSSVLVRRHNEIDVVKVMEEWWREVKNYSRRDQLSFNYVAWKNNFNFIYMKGDPRRNKYVFRLPHKRKIDLI